MVVWAIYKGPHPTVIVWLTLVVLPLWAFIFIKNDNPVSGWCGLRVKEKPTQCGLPGRKPISYPPISLEIGHASSLGWLMHLVCSTSHSELHLRARPLLVQEDWVSIGTTLPSFLTSSREKRERKSPNMGSRSCLFIWLGAFDVHALSRFTWAGWPKTVLLSCH